MSNCLKLYPRDLCNAEKRETQRRHKRITEPTFSDTWRKNADVAITWKNFRAASRHFFNWTLEATFLWDKKDRRIRILSINDKTTSLYLANRTERSTAAQSKLWERMNQRVRTVAKINSKSSTSRISFQTRTLQSYPWSIVEFNQRQL